MLRASEPFNLYRIETTNREESASAASIAFAEGLGAPLRDIGLSAVGLAAGDRVWTRGKVRNAVGAENSRLRIRFDDAAGSMVAETVGPYADNTAFAETVLENIAVPAGAVTMRAFADRESGSGSVSIRDVAIGPGPTAHPFSLPVRGLNGFALNALQRETRATLDRSNIEGRSPFSGRVQQTRMFERWRVEAQIAPLFDDDLRLYEDDLAALSGGAKTFNLVPPERFWNSLGQSVGALVRTVDGAGQTGVSLDINGGGTDALIARRGDLVSILTGPDFSGPYTLRRLAADVIDAAGTVAIALREPIFPAPLNGAHVRFTQPVVTASIAGDETVDHVLDGYGQINALTFEERFEVLT